MDVVGVDIIAASFNNSFELDTSVFVWPDIVVAILGAALERRGDAERKRPVLAATHSAVL